MFFSESKRSQKHQTNMASSCVRCYGYQSKKQSFNNINYWWSGSKKKDIEWQNQSQAGEKIWD